ncbi:MAG: hypothetical protein WAU88_05805 [Candidatus Zixiibacteriota bacterium]
MKLISGTIFAVVLVAAGLVGSCYNSNTAPVLQPLYTYEYIRDYQYAENRIFDIFPGHFLTTDLVQSVFVFVHESQVGSNTFRARLLMNPNDTTEGLPRAQYDYMRQVPQDDYVIVNDLNRNWHYLVFNESLPEGSIGIQLMIKHTDNSVTSVGRIDQDTLQLLMVKPVTGYSPLHWTWHYMWRNAYSIPRGRFPEDLQLVIFKGPIGSEASEGNMDVQPNDGTFLKLMGLDQYDIHGNSQSDNILDDRSDVFRPDWGLVIFPDRYPFDTGTTFLINGQWTVPLSEKPWRIYDYTTQEERVAASRYYLRYTVAH